MEWSFKSYVKKYLNMFDLYSVCLKMWSYRFLTSKNISFYDILDNFVKSILNFKIQTKFKCKQVVENVIVFKQLENIFEKLNKLHDKRTLDFI